jgi:hypothetical protein
MESIQNIQRLNDANKLVFQQGINLFEWQNKDGKSSLRQLTNFILGEKKDEKIDSNFLFKQQEELFEFFKDKDNYISLTAIIVNTFVKKCLVLSTLDRLQEVRKFVYLILSINLPPLDIVKTICKKLMKSKLSVETKRKILTHVTDYSKHCNNANKEVIPLETLFFNLILIIYA